jgi:hypothetical protein
MMAYFFQIWFFKCYRLVKWIPCIIFNHMPTHIVPNLKVPPLSPKLPLWHQKMDTLVCQDPKALIYVIAKHEGPFIWWLVCTIDVEFS